MAVHISDYLIRFLSKPLVELFVRLGTLNYEKFRNMSTCTNVFIGATVQFKYYDHCSKKKTFILDNSYKGKQQANRNSLRSLRLINLITGSSSVFQFYFRQGHEN